MIFNMSLVIKQEQTQSVAEVMLANMVFVLSNTYSIIHLLTTMNKYCWLTKKNITNFLHGFTVQQICSPDEQTFGANLAGFMQVVDGK